MKNRSFFLVLIMLFTIVSGSFFFPFSDPTPKSSSGWSEPVLLFSHPQNFKTHRFDTDVNAGVVKIAAAYCNLIDNAFLEYSGIYLISRMPDSNSEFLLLSSEDIPSESPTIFRDLTGKLHVFWGDRRQDPAFDLWPNDIPHMPIGFSTDIIYYSPEGDQAEQEHIFTGNTDWSGKRSIDFPITITEGEISRLHIAFSAFYNDNQTTLLPVYSTTDPMGEWSVPRSAVNEFGSNSNIVSLDENRLIISYLGSDPNQSSINDVLAVYSDDGGATWSSPELVFLSGTNPGWDLRMVKASDGKVHLLWGQGINDPFFAAPDAIWHCYTEDGGRTWTEPKMIYQLHRMSFWQPGTPLPEKTLLHIFYTFDLLTDSYGRMHWVGRSLRLFEGGNYERSFYYSNWSPNTGEWENFIKLELGNNPSWLSLAYDKQVDELYLLWTDNLENDQQGIFYSKKSVIVNVTEPQGAITGGPVRLLSNYPNPFSSETTIPFSLDVGGKVIISVYDMAGRRVHYENLGFKAPGYHEHRLLFNGQNNGNYILEITLDGKYRQQKNMVYVK